MIDEAKFTIQELNIIRHRVWQILGDTKITPDMAAEIGQMLIDNKEKAA